MRLEYLLLAAGSPRGDAAGGMAYLLDGQTLFSLFKQYSFQIVLAGTVFLAVAAALIGTFNVLKGQSLIGDAIGHSTYPGIVLAFMVMMSRNPVFLSLGALLLGFFAYSLISLIERKSRLSGDTGMAIVLSGFFALGSVLNAYVSSSPHFAKASQAGLKTYIFGQAADMLKTDVYMIVAAAGAALLFLLFSYKELKVCIFDPVFARSAGLHPGRTQNLLLIITLLLIAMGLKAVGIILISSLFIAPCIAAQQWTCRLKVLLLLAALMAGFSAFAGTCVSSVFSHVSTGPAIIVVLSGLVFLSMAAGPRGLLMTTLRRRRALKDQLFVVRTKNSEEKGDQA